MYIVCADLEGIFTPEIWINVSKITGIKELRLTTRDIPDYDVLMKRRLAILKQHGLKLQDIGFDPGFKSLSYRTPTWSLPDRCLKSSASRHFFVTPYRLKPME
jgi:hypothetical protein